MNLKIAKSSYGPEGPRNIGILFRLNRIGIMFCFWKWYLEFDLKLNPSKEQPK